MIANILRWLKLKPLDRVYREQEFFAPRLLAHYCTECDVVCGDGERCPRCQSTALIGVACFIKQEKESIRMQIDMSSSRPAMRLPLSFYRAAGRG